MRDQHKSRLDLVDEVVGLRKQVDDLKASSAVRRRVEDALRESDELHRRLLDALPAAIGCLDGSGHLLIANEALAQLLGYRSRAELMELGNVLGVFADRCEAKRVLDRLGETGWARSMEARCRSKTGEELRVALGAGAVSLQSDSVPRFALLFESVRSTVGG